MSLRPMSQQEVGRYQFVPQATLKRPPSFFASQGISFRTSHDDLDEFEVAELSLDDKLPFALLRYRGTPADETIVFLPDTFPLTEVPTLIKTIILALKLSTNSIKWQRETAQTSH
jgi:hypothetical protein